MSAERAELRVRVTEDSREEALAVALEWTEVVRTIGISGAAEMLGIVHRPPGKKRQRKKALKKLVAAGIWVRVRARIRIDLVKA